MKKLTCKQIETPRLILRAPEIGDAPMVFKNWASDPEVTKYLNIANHETVAVTEMILRLWIHVNNDHKGLNYLIIYKENKEIIGSINLVSYVQEEKSFNVGFCLSKHYWGMGIAGEALGALLKYIFSFKIKTIYAIIDVRNTRSLRVLEKCNFKFDERKDVWSYVENGMITTDRFKITRAEWKKGEKWKRKSIGMIKS